MTSQNTKPGVASLPPGFAFLLHRGSRAILAGTERKAHEP